MNNYTIQTYPDGRSYAINNLTGKTVNTCTVVVPSGSKIYTPEDIEARQLRLEREAKKAIIRKANQHKPRFFFVRAESEFQDLTPATVTRLIVLGTYCAYDGRLILNNRTPMKRSHLKEVLKLSDAAITNFWREVSPKYVTEHDGYLYLSDRRTFIRGNLPKYGHDYWIKFFITAVRTLYKKTDTSNHKHLGYIYQLLPFVNVEHNILCRNVFERDVEDIEPITLLELCDLIHYDCRNLYRLLQIFRRIKFKVNGREELFCKFVNDDVNISKSYIIINPRVLYSGSNTKAVENFGTLCKRSA